MVDHRGAAKHLALVRHAVDSTVVFVAPSLSAYNRSRLIKRGVPFVVPGRQLYIPDLAMDLREQFHTHKEPRPNALSPAAQAVLFLHLPRPDQAAASPSLIAMQPRYSAMSIGRAFDHLVDTGLAHAERRGKERHIRFKTEGRQLFDAAHDLPRGPVRARKFVRDGDIAAPLKHAGESALPDLTDLSPPPRHTLAVAAGDWKALAKTGGSSRPIRSKPPTSSKHGPATRPTCPARVPWTHCRSTRSSGTTVMSVSPWPRTDCWREWRGSRVLGFLDPAKPLLRTIRKTPRESSFPLSSPPQIHPLSPWERVGVRVLVRQGRRPALTRPSATPLHRSLLPRAHPVRMDLVPRCDLLDRLVPA